MKEAGRVLMLMLLGLIACTSHKTARALTLSIVHPDDPAKRVEYFLEKPSGVGPWPLLVFLHGHQEIPRAGGYDFVKWGILEQFAKRGYLAVAVSQPGYGNSTGPADFCGPFTQHAVAAVIAKIRSDGYVLDNRVLIEGISRGALVAGLVAAHDPSIRGIVLISGLYDLPSYTRAARSQISLSVVESMKAETGGGEDSLRVRSLLLVAPSLKVSTLILNGEKDDRTDPNQARRLADTINANGAACQSHRLSAVWPQYSG